MHLLKFYQLLIGNKASFLQPYTGDGQEVLYSQASLFWDKLDGLSIVFILLFFLIGVLAAWFYYKPFNEQPNRHYLPKYWWMFFIASAIVSFLVTFGAALGIAYPRISGTWTIEKRIALQNAFLTLVIYLLASVFICKKCTTNAYRMFL